MIGVVRVLTLYLFTILLAGNAYATGVTEGGRVDLTNTGPGLLAVHLWINSAAF